jgi:hypothetical protein
MLPFLSFCILTIVTRLALGSWAQPGALFAAVWLFYMAVSLLFSRFEALDPGLWWVVFSIACLAAGNIQVSTGADRKRETDGTADPHAEGPREITLPYLPYIVVATLMGVVVYYVLSPVYVLRDTMAKPPLWIQVFLSCLYVLPLFSGLLFASTRKWVPRFLAVLSFPVGMIMGPEFGGRSTMLMMSVLWLAGYIPLSVLREGKAFRVLSRERVGIALVVIALVSTNVVVATVSRQLEGSRLIADDRQGGWLTILEAIDIDKIDETLGGLESSTVGSLASFTWYFEREWQNLDWSMSYLPSMFSGPLELLDLMDRSTTAFETTYFSDNTGSNVYTLFRPIIGAFTLFGSVPVLYLLGIYLGRAYQRVLAGHPRAIGPLIVFNANIMVSGGLWFGYNTLDAAFLAVFLYLAWVERRLRRADASSNEADARALGGAPALGQQA